LANKIIYIAGYSRSGSTILDILLSSHPDIFGTGELVYLFDDWMNSTRSCSCGMTYENCCFWKNFKLPEGIDFMEAIKIIRNVEERKNVKALAHNSINSDVIQKYELIQSALYSYIFRTSGKHTVIDSSKSSRHMAGRFYALHTYTQLDVYVIHLIKNGLSVVESFVKKGRNWALEGYGTNDRFMAMRSSFGWLLANSVALRLAKKIPLNRYLQIKYEELTTQPENTLRRIGEFLDMDLSDIIALVKNKELLQAKHNVGGNRLRLEKEIRFNTSDKLKKNGLSVYQRFVFNLIGGRLNKRLGY
jgi:hypothetical protein